MNAHEPEVRVTDHRIRGVGHLLAVPLPDGTVVSVVVEDATNDRELHVLEPGDDEPRTRVRLPYVHAETIGALLSGMRLVFDDQDDDAAPRSGVQVRTIVIGASSPAVGRAVADIDLPAPEEARILAVIRDDTPEIIEEDVARTCQPGDRLVLAGRPGALDALRRFLLG